MESEQSEQSKDKGIKDLIKYFEIYYKITDVISFQSKEDQIFKTKSLSSSKMVILFVNIVLDFYYNNKTVPIDYSSNLSNDTKIKLMGKIYETSFETDLTDFKKLKIELFDLCDFMFKTLKKVLERIYDGFTKWKEEDESFNASFNTTIYPNIDLLLYLIFYTVFPDDLKILLHKELRISDIEYSIIKRCNDSIIRHNARVCNPNYNGLIELSVAPNKFDFIADKDKSFFESISPSKLSPTKFLQKKENKNTKSDFSLEKSDGARTLFSILLQIRTFNNRRRSRTDSI